MDDIKKLTGLFVPIDEFGCGLYRMFQPAHTAARLHPQADLIIHYSPPPDFLDSEEGKDVQFIVIQRIRLQRQEGGTTRDLNRELVERAHAKGIPVVYEHDDNDFALPATHGLFYLFQQDRISDKVQWLLTNCDFITTTTDYLADRFAEHGADRSLIYVFPNCLDFTNPYWNVEYQPCRRTRIGWAGGSSHAEDLKQLTGVFSKLLDLPDIPPLQLILGGFDTRGSYTFFDAQGNRVTRPIEEHETIWNAMAHTYFNGAPDGVSRVMRTLPINNYGFFFSQFDIGVVPLEDTEFTRAKSPLKLLELGAYAVPAVISDVLPYREMLKDTQYDLELLVPVGRKSTPQWVNKLLQLIKDEPYRTEQGRRLQRIVSVRYNEETWSPLRMQFWEQVANHKIPDHPNPKLQIEYWDEV